VAGLPSPISLPPAIRRYARYVAQPPALDYVVVNTRQRPLTNSTLRQALALSINRTSLVKNVLGTSAMPTGALVPPSILPGAFQQQFDPQTALRILVRAHLAPPPLTGGGSSGPTLPANVRPLRLLYLNTTAETRKAQFLQQLWERYLGVQVHPMGKDYPGYVTALRTGQFDLALVQWGAQYLDASNFLNFQLRGNAPENLSGWNDPSFNRIMRATLGQGIDSESRHADLLMAALIAAQQAPWIALDEPLQLTLVHTSAGAVALTPGGWAGFVPGT
jgi:oligopeptide transport system substrate-binding protein